jgi:hypothetical protein
LKHNYTGDHMLLKSLIILDGLNTSLTKYQKIIE